MNKMMEVVTPILPKDKPRYLMGVGSPEDLVNGIWRGIDFFDCVLPTRLARHGAAMTFRGRLNMVNQKYTHDSRPIVEGCTCYTCQHFSRAYIRHLLQNKEMLAATLLSIHNIHTLEEARASGSVQPSLPEPMTPSPKISSLIIIEVGSYKL